MTSEATRILVVASNKAQLRAIAEHVVKSPLASLQGVIVNYPSDAEKLLGQRYDVILGLHLIKSDLATQIRANCLR